MCPENENTPVRNYERYDLEFNALPFERILEKYRRRKLIEILSHQVPKDFRDVLEIGPGYKSVLGDLKFFGNTVIIEPSSQLYDYNTSKYAGDPNVIIFNEDIEKFCERMPLQEFDVIILSSVLHEFADVGTEMSRIRKLMKKNGQLIIVVPNNESIHRQFGVTLGILASTSMLTNTEILMQQNQNFSMASLSLFLDSLGFETKFGTTSFVKPHTHAQMQDWIDKGLLDDGELEKLYDLSEFFHPFNSEIFLVVSKA